MIRKAEAPPSRVPSLALATLAVCAGTVATLYFAQQVLIPIALALLLSFVLSPGVTLLRRWHVGRVTSVMVMVTFACVIIFGLGTVIVTQLAGVGAELPRYERTIRDKIRAVRDSAAENSIIERFTRSLQRLSAEVGEPADEGAPPAAPGVDAGGPEGVDPIPVVIQQPSLKPLELIQTIVGPVLARLATLGIIIVFVIFMLLQREDLRDRFIRLTGSQDMHRTTTAITDAGERVSQYLLMQTMVNATYALPLGIGLWLIGVPDPLLWSVLAGLLRFVPYVGPVIAALFPLALSVAVDPGWSMFLWTAGLILGLELVSNNVIEPWLYGSSTGLSPIAIILAATFWTWLWGPIGLLLSTPLTSCLVVLGRHVPRLQFLDVALGDQPVLRPEVTFYQRLLANDPSGAASQAEEFLKQKPLSAFYDEVVIPALALAQLDIIRAVLDGERQSQILAAIEEVTDDLSDSEDLVPQKPQSFATKILEQLTEKRQEIEGPPAEPQAEAPTSGATWRDNPILCVASRTDLDEAAARLLAQLLGKNGCGARVLPWEAVSFENLVLLDPTGVQILCVSCLDPRHSPHLRFLLRRLRRKFPDARILVGFWAKENVPDAAKDDPIAGSGADLVANSLRQAMELIFRTAGDAQPTASREL